MSVEQMREAAAKVADDEDQEIAYCGTDEGFKGASRALKEVATIIRALPIIPPDPAAEALRAAAPDLYEALAAVVAVHDRDTALVGKLSRGYINVCWNRARAALKKARAGVPDRKEAT